MASTLTTSGLGSGLDINGLVAKLVAAERGPADSRLLKEDRNLTADLTAISKLRGALTSLKSSADGLKDASALIQRLASSTDYGVLGASADATAIAGSYDIEVMQLAAVGRQTSVALGSAYSTDVETGTITVQQGSSSFNVVVNASNNTLSGVRDAINAAAGSTGVTATLLSTTDGIRLQLAGGAMGAANNLTFSTSNGSGSGSVRLSDLFTDRLTSAAYMASSQQLQSGSVTVTQGTTSFSVSLSGGSRSLQDFADAVNTNVGNPGIVARVVTGADSKVRVLLTGAAGGVGTPISLTAAGSGGGGYDIALADFVANSTGQAVQKVAAADAIVKVDGMMANSASNSLQNVIQGVTINVTKVSTAGTPVKLSISSNDAAVKNKALDFVTSYNQLSSTISALGGYEASTKTAGPMLGDSLLMALTSQVRKTLGNVNTDTSQTYTTLASLGIVSRTDGTLAVDDAKLSAALKADAKSLSYVFSGSGGVASAFSSMIDKHLVSTGDISARESAIALQRKDLDKRRVALDARMVAFQARQLKIFNSLDGMLSKMQTTSSALSQSLAKAASG